MSGNKKQKELIINTIIFGLGTIGAKVVMFMLLPIYTNYMSASQLGAAELVVNAMNLAYPIVTINIISALLRFGMSEDNNKASVFQNTVLVTVTGCLVFSLAITVIPINNSLGDLKLYLILMIWFYSIEQIASVFSKALDKTLIFAVGNIIYTISLLLSSLLLLVAFNRGTEGYLEGIILANIITTCYFVVRLDLIKYCKKNYINRSLIREMVWFSLPLIINSVSWWITSFCDRFVIEFYLDTSSVGVYSISAKIPALVSTISSIFMQAWVLSSIKEYERDRDPKFFESVFKRYAAMFILSASVIISISKNLTELLSGVGFKTSWQYVPLLMCATVFTGFGGFFAALYTSAKKNSAVMLTTLFGAIANIAMNFLLIPTMGIQGAVVATVLSNFTVMICRLIGSRRFCPFKIKYAKLFFGLILMVVESIFLLLDRTRIFMFIPLVLIIFLYWKDNYDFVYRIFHYTKGVIRNANSRNK